MEKKFFGFDLDGTLLTDKRTILESTMKAIEKLEEQGHVVAVVTGRGWVQYQSIKKMLNDYDIHPLYIGNNGSVYKRDGHELHIMGGVEKDLCKWVLQKSKEHNGLIHMYSGTKMFDSLLGNPESLNEVRKIGHSGHKQELENEETMHSRVDELEINQITLKQSPEIVKSLFNEMPEKFKENNIVDIISNVYLESNPIGLTKYTGVLRVCEHLNIKKENIYVFGDSNNDLPMMRKDINSVAMGNAIEIIKDAAKYHTDTNNNDGIYKFLVKHNII